MDMNSVYQDGPGMRKDALLYVVLHVALTRIFGTRISLLRLHNIAIRSWMPLDQDHSTRRKNGDHITSCRKKKARFMYN